MKKNKIYTVIAVILIVAAYSFNNPNVDFKVDSNKGIQFHKGTWEEALALAKKENKMLFLDVYATWCGPCKKLKKHTFSNEVVGQFYNSNFINVSFDGEKVEGLKLADKYKLTGYPSLLFIDSSGKIVTKTTGFMNSEQFINLGKSVLSN